MRRKKEQETVLLRAAEMFDLPRDVAAGLPYMELWGDREFLMDHHQGILSYSQESIDINAGALVVRLQGEELELLSMTGDALRVGGKLRSIQLVR